MKKYSSLKELLDDGGKVAFPEQIFISPGKDTKKEFRKPRPMWLPDNPDNVRLFAESSSLLGLSKERFLEEITTDKHFQEMIDKIKRADLDII